MYSNNDFRYYSENHLEHGWGWKPAQKAREKEYNAWYYAKNKFEKWGVKEGLEKLEDKVDEKVSGVLDKGLLGKTQLDNKLYEAGKKGYAKLKKSAANAPKKYVTSAAGRLERARRQFEATRDNPKASSAMKYAAAQTYRRAKQAYDATARGRAERAIDSRTNRAAQTAERGYNAVRSAASNVSTAAGQAKSDARYKATSARRDARVKADLAARNLERKANSAVETVKNRKNNVGGVGAQGISTDGSGSSKRNFKERVNQFIDNSNTKLDDKARDIYRNTRDAVKNAPGNIRDTVNRRIDESDTRVDNYARSAVRSLRSGNIDAARTSAKSALNEVGKDINRRIDKSETLADDYARSAARSLKEGNFKQAGKSAGRAARAAAYDVKEGARKLAGAASDAWKNRNNVTLGEDREDNRDINPATGRPRRTATVNTNTARDNGTLVPHQKNRKQPEPERQKDSLAGKNIRVTDAGTGLNAAKRAARNWEDALKQENRIHRAQNGYFNSQVREDGGRMDKEQANSMGNREKDKEFLGIDGRRPDEQISRGQRGKDFQNRRFQDASNKYINSAVEFFTNMAEGDGKVSSGTAAKAVNQASDAISAYVDAVYQYGSGSEEANEAYWEAVNAIMGNLEKKN